MAASIPHEVLLEALVEEIQAKVQALLKLDDDLHSDRRATTRSGTFPWQPSSPSSLPFESAPAGGFQMNPLSPRPPRASDFSALSDTSATMELLYHRLFMEPTQSYEPNFSNFSNYTAPSAIYKDREDLAGQDRCLHTSRHDASNPFWGQNFSVSGSNYSDTPQKSAFSLQNVSATSGVEPDRRSPDVHDIHPVHSALELGVKLPSRLYSHSINVGTNDNVDESCSPEARIKSAFDPHSKTRGPRMQPGIRCYHCQEAIVGPRFHCVDCTTIDIDICWKCDIAGFPGVFDVSDGGHSSSHAMLKIPMSLNTQEIQRVSRRADDLRHAGDRVDLHVNLHIVSPPPLARLSPKIGEGHAHPQVCNSCSERIFSTRYQCLNCPSKPFSFNLCSECAPPFPVPSTGSYSNAPTANIAHRSSVLRAQGGSPSVPQGGTYFQQSQLATSNNAQVPNSAIYGETPAVVRTHRAPVRIPCRLCGSLNRKEGM